MIKDFEVVSECIRISMDPIVKQQEQIQRISASVAYPYNPFEDSIADKINEAMLVTLNTLSANMTQILADSISAIVENMSYILQESIYSSVIEWIQSYDAYWLYNFLEELHLDEEVLKRYKELNKVYLTTMYDCKWFPYAGWTVNASMMAEVSDIIATSRGKSKNRERRIDKVILGYYDSKEIKNIKRSWKSSDLEPHIKKILGQAIEAHLRGEYVLTIACLATMWEGLIHRKLQINGRCCQKETKEKFEKLIEENNFESIFSDFYKDLIVSQCNTPDDVIEGVPNRNAISHSKYKKYPNKKASLNAILLTDFIIALEPKLKMEED